MPPSRQVQQIRPRKGHYSCEFCRVRKLRCSRPLPCINCVSRGKTCVMDVEGPVVEDRQPTPSSRPLSPPNQPSGTSNELSNHALLDEVHRLRRLAEDLERRISHGGSNATNTSQAQHLLPSVTHTVPSTPTSTPAPDALGPICAVVTHLDRVSMGKGCYSDMQAASSTASPSALSSTTTLATGRPTATTTCSFEQSGLTIKIEPILSIPTASEYTYSIVDGNKLGSPRRCVYLPLYQETTVLLDTFLKTVSSFYHIVHHPTVPSLVAGVYDSVQRQQGADLSLGDVLLVLNMIATGTCLYGPPTQRGIAIFSSREEAARQTPYWIEIAIHVLDAITRGPAPPTLSAVQGVITLSFLISNIEGVGYRYRYIVSTALLLGRELGLHCIDQEHSGSPQNSSLTTPFQRELGRRAWWYLASTDWLLAARNSGPGVGVYQTHPQMMRVREPCNIDDSQLQEGNVDEPIHGLPLDVPTDMSYYLQRMRLSKVARSIVDRMPMVSGTQFVGGSASSSASAASLLAAYRESAIASDAELDAMLRDMPPFLRFETYEQSNIEWTEDDEDGKSPKSLFIQAFMLHSLIHTQRCKLHLSYLTSWRRQTGTNRGQSHTHGRPSVSNSTTTSRAVCIEAARQIIHAETQLRRRAAKHPFVQSRLSCVLYGVFLATIVLLIDLCADNGAGSETDPGDDSPDTSAAFAALQIVSDARPYSPAAAELCNTSLTQLLSKHRPQLLEEGLQRLGTPMPAISTTTAGTARTVTSPTLPTTATVFNNPPQEIDSSSLSFNDAMYTNPLALHFDGLDDFAQFQWDDLLAGVDTTMFV